MVMPRHEEEVRTSFLQTDVVNKGNGHTVARLGIDEVAEGVTNVAAVGVVPGFFAALSDSGYMPLIIIFTTVLLAGVVLTAWWVAVRSDGSKKKEKAVSSPAATWLGLLAMASCGLLAVQLGMGYYFHSLTLMADSAHTAADAIGYSFAYLVERAKADINQAAPKNTKVNSLIDVLSAGFSVTVVLVTTGSAGFEAIDRLTGKDKGMAETDFRYMGAALLAFAVLSTGLNVALLLMHPRFIKAEKSADEAAVEEAVAMVPPPPPPFDVPYATVPPRPAGDALLRPPRQRPGQKLKLLHMAFHPGCDGEHCLEQHGNAGSVDDPSVAPEANPLTPGVDARGREESLNVRGAYLHLITDVLRSLIIFAAGILVVVGWIRRPALADAVCALLVGMCVVVGSGMIACNMMVKMRQLLKK